MSSACYLGLSPVFFSALKKEGFESTNYIDDSFQNGISKDMCTLNIISTVTMLSDLGFIIHPDKSVLVPTQNIVFLGFSIDMPVSLTKEKAQKIKTAILDFLRARRSTICDLCKIIDMLIASFRAVSYGKLLYRKLENEKIIALKKSCGDFDSPVFLSPVAKLDLQW